METARELTAQASQPAAPEAAGPLRVLVVCGVDFASPSEKQALALARELGRLGHRVLLSFAGEEASADAEGARGLAGVELHRHRLGLRGPAAADAARAAGFRPHAVHAWNPRAPVLAVARAYAARTGAPLFAHFEDDEWTLLGGPPGTRARRQLWRARRGVAGAVPRAWHWATPAGLAWTAEHARALDALTPALAQHVEARLGRPCAVVLPLTWTAPASGAPAPPLPEGRVRLVYTGALHPVHAADVELGLRATALLQRRGRDVVWVHAGTELPGVSLDALARRAGVAPGSAVGLGHLPAAQVPALLERADVLVQPGHPSDFNRFRLPSKLQTYLAAGRPVVTFAAGFGELLRDGAEALTTRTGEPEELAGAVERVLDDPGLAERLSRGAREAAARLFDPGRNAAAMVEHYRAHLGPA